MKSVLASLFVCVLLAFPVAAQDIGTLTLLEGPLHVIRGTVVLKGVEGMRMRQGDIVETSGSGLTQMEFHGGPIVAIGPSSRLYLFRYAAGSSGGKDAPGVQFVLLSGWLKAETSSRPGACRYESPLLAAATRDGTFVLNADGTAADIYVESGSGNICEVSAAGGCQYPSNAKSGQFYSRVAGKKITTSPHPSSAFVASMPPPFRDTFPSRLSHFTRKPPEPKVDHQVTYAEIGPWLSIPTAWRRGFVPRFQPRLQDAEFRKELAAHLREHPEWDPVLFPEKYRPKTMPATANNPQSSQEDEGGPPK